MARCRSGKSAALLALLAVAGLFVVGSAARAVGPGDEVFVRASSNDDDEGCDSRTASDYYGLGVRLGIYFSWLTGYVANISVPDEIAGALDTNAIFLFALLVSVVQSTVNDSLRQVDALVVMQISAGGLFSIFSLWGYRTCQYCLEGPAAIRHYGGFGTHFRLLISTAVSVYGLWFWKFGLKDAGGVGALKPVPHDGCDVLYTFFFAKLPAAGGIRYFYLTVCIGCTIYYGAILLVSSVAGFTRAARMINLARAKSWSATSRLTYRTGLTIKELRFGFRFLRIGDLVWLVFSMIMVECTLNFNSVEGVLGDAGRVYLPSQLLPMLIGAFSFIRILWIRYERWRNPHDIAPSLPPAGITAAAAIDRQSHGGNFRPGRDLLRLFSPTFIRGGGAVPSHDGGFVYEAYQGPAWKRYLVSWLPWLSLLPPFRADIKILKEREDRAA